MVASKQLTQDERADLADLRLVLGSAEHNLRLAAAGGEEWRQALDNALRQTEQVVAGLARVRDRHGG